MGGGGGGFLLTREHVPNMCTFFCSNCPVSTVQSKTYVQKKYARSLVLIVQCKCVCLAFCVFRNCLRRLSVTFVSDLVVVEEIAHRIGL